MEAQIKQTPRPPIDIVPTISKALSDVIMMAISKDPAQRFQSADAFRNALSQISSSAEQLSQQQTQAGASRSSLLSRRSIRVSPSRISNSGSQSNRTLLLVLGAVLVAALLGGTAMYRSRQHSPQEVAAASSGDSRRSRDPRSNTQSQNPPTPAATDSQPPEAPQQPAVIARKARAPGQNVNAAPAMSAEDIQAQQQAALEQKKQLDAMETEIDQLDSRAASGG